MKKYFKPKIMMLVLELDDVLTASVGMDFGEEFDNGADDVLWDLQSDEYEKIKF